MTLILLLYCLRLFGNCWICLINWWNKNIVWWSCYIIEDTIILIVKFRIVLVSLSEYFLLLIKENCLLSNFLKGLWSFTYLLYQIQMTLTSFLCSLTNLWFQKGLLICKRFFVLLFSIKLLFCFLLFCFLNLFLFFSFVLLSFFYQVFNRIISRGSFSFLSL